MYDMMVDDTFAVVCSVGGEQTLEMQRRRPTATSTLRSAAVAMAGSPEVSMRRSYKESWGQASLGDSTKGNPYMKHLDLYARRDPQLAPYLLREVDIEFKRQCRKVNFVVWVAFCVFMMLWDQRANAEVVYYLRKYAEMIQAEAEAQDLDNDLRRSKLVGVMAVVKSAFDRDAKWTVSDYQAAVQVLQSSDLDQSQRSSQLSG